MLEALYLLALSVYFDMEGKKLMPGWMRNITITGAFLAFIGSVGSFAYHVSL